MNGTQSATPPPRGDTAGSSLGRYRLGPVIGAGGMGTVVRGTDEVLGREVALKLIRADLAGNERALARFRQEARIAASLSHPGIAAVFDFAEDDTRQAIVMELLDGKDLHTVLQQNGPVEPAAAAGILAEAAEALNYAHEHGAVHRDVKPANIVLTRDGTVKLTDFGVAHAAGHDQLTTTGALIGTPDYLSPEQVRGERSTAASDIYSLGCVAFQLLTGQPPFSGDNAISIATARLELPPPSPRALNPAVSEEFDAVVRCALAPDPAGRFPSAGAFAYALRSVVRSQPGSLVSPVLAADPGLTTSITLPVGASAPTLVDLDPGAPPGPPGGPPPPPVWLPPGDQAGGLAFDPPAFGPPGLGPPGLGPPAFGPPPAGPAVGYGPPPGYRATTPAVLAPSPRRHSRWVWLWLPVMAILMGGISFDIVRGIQKANAPVTVRNWTGETYQTAEAQATHLGLHVARNDQDSAKPAGIVTGSAPGPGATVHRGRTITLLVSKGNLFAVPDVRNEDVNTATNALQGDQLQVSIDPNTVVGTTAGQVVDQSPAPGTEVAHGTTVTLTVTALPQDTSGNGDSSGGDNGNGNGNGQSDQSGLNGLLAPFLGPLLGSPSPTGPTQGPGHHHNG